VPEETLYYNFEYEEEFRRGLAWTENLFSPGYFSLELSGDTNFAITASTWRTSMVDWVAKKKMEEERLQSLIAPVPELAKAADAFLVKRGNSLSLIAGYHWFDDWGRDAMIALPGLLLTTGRFREAKAVLKSFADSMIDGVLANDLGARSYNTVDASLWFIRAVWSYYQSSKDLEFVRWLWPGLLEVMNRYSQTRKEFGRDGDGLIVSGPAFTWMDARVDGRPVTPRAGKCCEINALWFSALDRMETLAKALEEPEVPGFSESREKVRQSYNKFWNSETGCLYDVIDPNDASIRPNQIIAVTVPDLLSLTKRKSILEVVTRDLLTPCGLRTLSPRDPRYAGRYEGGPARRDEAYHRGTVWPWLLGPYIDAYLSVNGRSEETRRKAAEILQPLLEPKVGGIDTIPEIFDGQLPQRPGGCIAQAWSVAEVLRAWAEVHK
jgi:predicted glycogen debranching enzyme